MSTIKLLHKIYAVPELCCSVVLYYERRALLYSSISHGDFISVCKKHGINSQPSVLIRFFESEGINILTMPTKNSNSWSSRVYTESNLLIRNDYKNRPLAIEGALETAIEIFQNKN